MSTGTLVPEGIYLPPPGYQLVPDSQWEQLQAEVSGEGRAAPLGIPNHYPFLGPIGPRLSLSKVLQQLTRPRSPQEMMSPARGIVG